MTACNIEVYITTTLKRVLKRYRRRWSLISLRPISHDTNAM